MKTNLKLLIILLMLCTGTAVASTNGEGKYVGVRDGKFYVDGHVYNYVGTNFWYGAILASDGEGGDPKRLKKELDLLQKTGIDNLRILVGGDGPNGIASHIEPTLQKEAGVYNDTILVGLDRLVAELERRGMKAVMYMNNAWEWSGGYSTYLQWAGAGKAPVPSVDGWPAYMKYVQQFVNNDKAMEFAMNNVRFIVSRVNTVTGKPYSESPAIMSWQIANEPRAFSDENKRPFAKWIRATAKLIRSLDANHMISTGSEGMHGCEDDIELWNEIHSYPEVDYANVHIWPYNWSWINKETINQNLDSACMNTKQYIADHYAYMSKIGKPVVLEEFGYPRDGFKFEPGSKTTGRDAYYKYVFSIIKDSGMIAGCNFWGWGGYAEPKHTFWQKGDAYTGDPAQEEQGLNSVFAKDKSTLKIIRNSVKAIVKSNKK